MSAPNLIETPVQSLAIAQDPKSKPQPLKKFLRPLWFRMRLAVMFFAARLPLNAKYNIVFILGCGRSGTTIIGDSIGADADVLYINEPYYIWHNVTHKTDFSNVFRKNGNSWLFRSDVEERERVRLKHILSTLALIKRRKYIVEKTPINSLRVDWIRGLDPNARFVVVRREWVDIVNSIIDLAANHRYGVGYRDYHVWWGDHHFKVESLLARDPFDLASPAFREFIKERLIAKDFVSVDLNMAVFEVLASQIAIDRALTEGHMDGKDYTEIHYSRFVEAPLEEISRVLKWIKNGKEPKLLAGAFSNVKLSTRPNRISKDNILRSIHPDLREIIETHLV